MKNQGDAVAVSFVMPVRNDPRALAGVARLQRFLSENRIDGEVITCGEWSRATRAHNGRHVEIRPASKGACVRSGVLASRGSVVVLMDADVPVADRDIVQLIHETAISEVVLGSRILAKSIISKPRSICRRIASFGFRGVIALLFGLRAVDTQCGAKAVLGHAAKAILAEPLTCGLIYDVEFVLRARALGYRITQVPVEWSDGVSTISLWIAVPAAIWDVLRLVFSRSILFRQRNESTAA